MRDTTAAAQERYFELLREMSPVRRLQVCLSLSQSVRELVLAGIRHGHARTLSPLEERHYLAERLYGSQVATQYFPLPHE